MKFIFNFGNRISTAIAAAAAAAAEAVLKLEFHPLHAESFSHQLHSISLVCT